MKSPYRFKSELRKRTHNPTPKPIRNAGHPMTIPIDFLSSASQKFGVPRIARESTAKVATAPIA